MGKLHQVVAVAAAVAFPGVFAQTTPSMSATKPQTGVSSSESVVTTKDPIHADKEAAAQSAAESWLVLLDRGEFGLAWDAGAHTFRERVSREQWVAGLPTVRSPYGPMRSRQTEGVTYKTSMPGAPSGEYVTIRFKTDFEKKVKAEELISLAFEDGTWKPTGYVIR